MIPDKKLVKKVFENPLNVCDRDAHNSKFLHVNEMQWEDVKGEKGASGVSGMPQGLKRILLVGDPNLPGLSIFRFKYPPNYRVPAHFHWMAEHTTVLEGDVWVGFGDKYDESKLVKFSAGDFFTMPVGMPHYVVTRDVSPVFELHAIGPWQMTYCNPDEHPHK